MEIHPGAVLSIGSGWEQHEGSLAVDSGAIFVGEPSFWQLEDGSQTFGAGVEPNIHYFRQDAGELSVGQTEHLHLDIWDHRGGASMSPRNRRSSRECSNNEVKPR